MFHAFFLPKARLPGTLSTTSSFLSLHSMAKNCRALQVVTFATSATGTWSGRHGKVWSVLTKSFPIWAFKHSATAPQTAGILHGSFFPGWTLTCMTEVLGIQWLGRNCSSTYFLSGTSSLDPGTSLLVRTAEMKVMLWATQTRGWQIRVLSLWHAWRGSSQGNGSHLII